MSRIYVVIFLLWVSVAQSAAKIDIAGAISAVELNPANNFVIFGDISLGAWMGTRWAFSAEYFRNIGLSPDIGQIVVGIAKAKFLIKPGEWEKDSLWGMSAAYQAYKLNSGTLPVAGVGVFGSIPIETFDVKSYASLDLSYYFSTLDTYYEIGSIYNIDMDLRFEVYPRLFPLVGISYRQLSYRRQGSTVAMNGLAYSALNLGLAYTY